MLTITRKEAAGLAFVAAMTLTAGTARADAVEDFYKQKGNVELLIGYGPASGYETWARAVGKHLKNHVPGNPNFVVRNIPGAGDIVMLNYLFSQAPRDGSAIASFGGSSPAQALMGVEGARFDPQQFNYLGSPESSDHACLFSKASGINTVADLRAKEVPVGGNGPTTVNSYMPPIINRFVGTKLKVIEGYQSSGETFIAIERGEIGGACSKLDTMLRTLQPQLKSGTFKILFNLNPKPAPALEGTGIPTVFDFIDKPEDKQMMTFVRSLPALGRPFATPPGVPADRLAALTKAFEETVKDPEFLKDAATLKFDVTYTSGKQLAEMVDIGRAHV